MRDRVRCRCRPAQRRRQSFVCWPLSTSPTPRTVERRSTTAPRRARCRHSFRRRPRSRVRRTPTPTEAQASSIVAADVAPSRSSHPNAVQQRPRTDRPLPARVQLWTTGAHRHGVADRLTPAWKEPQRIDASRPARSIGERRARGDEPRRKGHQGDHRARAAKRRATYVGRP